MSETPLSPETEVPRFLLDLRAARAMGKAAASSPPATLSNTTRRRSTEPLKAESVTVEPDAIESVATKPAVNELVTNGPASASDPQQLPAREQAAATFQLIPLTEPVLAPPAEEEWDRTSQRHVARALSPQLLRSPDARQFPPERQRSVAANPPTRDAKTVSASPPPSESFSEETPFGDLFPADDLFPEDTDGEDAELELIDEDLFLFPRRMPSGQSEAEPEGAATVGRRAGTASTRSHSGEPRPEPSPYTGRRLNNDDFPDRTSRIEGFGPMSQWYAPTGSARAISVLDDVPHKMPSLASTFPSDSFQGTLAQPGRIFVEDERAIDPPESLDIDPDTLVSSSFRPSGTDTLRDTPSHFQVALAGSPKQQIATRDGLGLKGFCPVALRDRRVLKDGRNAYLSYFAGKSYFFSSSQAKAAFDDNPRRYAPAADGYDVTRTAIAGETREGSLDHAVWYRDRLYLFDSVETLKTFMALPSAMGVDE